MSGDKIKRVRAVRKWLEKAEDSYSSHKEINGEINLIMAQAEMQRLNETHKYVSVRHWAMRLFALCVALGVFFALNSSWHMIPWEKAEKEPDLIVIQEVKESSLPAEKNEIKAEDPAPAAGTAVLPSEAAAEVIQAVPQDRESIKAEAPAPPAETFSAPAAIPKPALSDKEIQSVVGEAGRALRGQA